MFVITADVSCQCLEGEVRDMLTYERSILRSLTSMRRRQRRRNIFLQLIMQILQFLDDPRLVVVRTQRAFVD